MPVPRVYKSKDAPGFWGYVGCDSDIYESDEEACEAAIHDYCETGGSLACPDCGNTGTDVIAETGAIQCPDCCNEF